MKEQKSVSYILSGQTLMSRTTKETSRYRVMGRGLEQCCKLIIGEVGIKEGSINRKNKVKK